MKNGYNILRKKEKIGGTKSELWKGSRKRKIMNKPLEITKISCQEIRFFHRRMLGDSKKTRSGHGNSNQNSECKVRNLTSRVCLKL